MRPDDESLADRVQYLLQQDRMPELRRLLQSAHPADIADAVDVLEEEERLRVFSLLDDQTAGEVLDETRAEATTALLKDLDSERTADILDEMPPDDAAEILAELPRDQVNELIGLMDREDAADVRELLQHPEGSAGRLMTEKFISISARMTASQVLEMLREQAPKAETAYYLYVTDETGCLRGVLSLRDLVVASPSAQIGDIMNPSTTSVRVDTDQEEAARIVAKYDFLALPVVDMAGRLVGIITVDDIIDVIEEEASEDIYALSGSSEDPEVVYTPLSAAPRRLPWILITVVGELLTGLVIRGYESTLRDVFTLVLFMPVLMATGGNVGSQSVAVMVRRLALGEAAGRNIRQIIRREALTGIILGAISGSFAAGVAVLWRGNPVIGLVIAISMTLTFTLSAVVGTLLPIMFKALGRDPAFASGPLISWWNDFTSVTIYFFVAVSLLALFGR